MVHVAVDISAAVDCSGTLSSFIITVGKRPRGHLSPGVHSRDPFILRMRTTLIGVSASGRRR